MQTTPEQPMSEEKEPASRSTLIWMIVVALIGFGFAIFRFIQFTTQEHPLRSVRLTRIELYIYRATGYWGVIVIFLLMGVFGLYNAIKTSRALSSSKP